MEVFSIIAYEGDNDTFVWKHPKEDFSTLSQLVVHESQEAVLFFDGQPWDLFPPGHYTLETNNIPLLQKIANIPTGGVSPFHCEVYFINKTEQMAIRWGTDSKVEYIDPNYGIPLAIGANGEMSLRVQDSRKLLANLVGTERELSRERLVSYFRAVLMTKIKSHLALFMRTGAVSIFEVDEHLQELSDVLKEKLIADFADYGVALERFFVTAIAKPEGDPQYERLRELHFRQYADVAEAKLQQQTAVIQAQTEAKKTVIESQALADKRAQEGYTYQQERGYDVAEAAAGSGAPGDAINAALRAGAPVQTAGARYCESCGAELSPGAAFCEACGAAVAAGKCCPRCGYHFARPGKFCPQCGARRGVEAESGE